MRILADENQPAGVYQYAWDGATSDGNSVGSGLYFAHVKSGSVTKIKKIVVVK